MSNTFSTVLSSAKISCSALFFSLFLISCGGGSSSTPTNPTTPQPPTPPPTPAPDPAVTAIETLWPQTVTPYLAQELWRNENMYDAGLALMLPIEYAFQTADNSDFKADLHNFYQRYVAEYQANAENNFLSRHQFHYAMVRYLKYSMDDWGDAQQTLYTNLLADFQFDWFEEETLQLSYEGTRDNIMEQKLAGIGQTTPKFRRTTIDAEFYAFSIAGELAQIQRALGEEVSTPVQNMLDLAFLNFQQEVVQTAQGWLYQPGQWEDHVDYIYAGHDTLTDDLTPFPVAGIATDSSHSHRMPLWLTSIQLGFEASSNQHSFFAELREGFESQFIDVVFLPSSDDFAAPRMTNFMDGWNGIYRYRFHDIPSLKLGYEPYNLSGTLLTGYYPFMYNAALQEEYRNLSFPLGDDIQNLYLGLGGTPDPSRAFNNTEYYTSGFAELYANIASLMTE